MALSNIDTSIVSRRAAHCLVLKSLVKAYTTPLHRHLYLKTPQEFPSGQVTLQGFGSFNRQATTFGEIITEFLPRYIPPIYIITTKYSEKNVHGEGVRRMGTPYSERDTGYLHSLKR